MPRYNWEGKTLRGEKRKGEMEAPDEGSVRTHLRQQNVIPTKVVAKGKQISFSFGRQRVKKKDVAIFTRQLATMIDAGLPLVQSLDILAMQQESKAFQEAIKSIKESVEGGSTFAAALGRHPKVFDELYVNLVIAGEEGGILDNVLNRLAVYIEKAEALKKKVKSALVYPSTIVCVAVLVVAILMIFVIPVFDKMFTSMGHTLPLPTLIVIGISKIIKKFFLLLIVALVVFIFMLKRYYATEKGKMAIDSFILKTPVFGILFRKVAVARFSRTLSTLITSGVPILDGLTITSKTAGSKPVEYAIMKARTSISEGETIAEPLARSEIFPPMVTQMIAVGESTGSLDSMLSKIADFYEEEVDVAVATLTSLLEPLLMVFLGVTVGGIVIAMYMPIFKIATVGVQ